MNLKESDISRWEEQRVRGETKDLQALTQELADKYSGYRLWLSDNELPNAMRAWRIWAVTLMTLYRKQWNGKRAAEYLLQAKSVILNLYKHPSVVKAAEAMRQDPNNREYQMRAEMTRDEAKYFLRAAQLTGNVEFLSQAILLFGRAGFQAEQNSSAQALSFMEEQIALKQRDSPGDELSWPNFTTAYNNVVKLASMAGGWDRMAAVSWWYTREAVISGRKKEASVGMKNLLYASEHLGKPWIRYPLEEAIGTVFNTTRRLTKGPIQPQELALE